MSLRLHEARCLDSLQDKLFWKDDFLGDQLKDEWTLTVSGAGSSGAIIDGETGGVYRLTAGAANWRFTRIEWNQITNLFITKRVCMETRCKLDSATNVNTYIQLNNTTGARQDFIGFSFNTGDGDTNWQIETDLSGTPTSEDSGQTPDTSYHVFRIESAIDGSNHIHFYYDGTEVTNSPISTNLPTAALMPDFFHRAKSSAAKTLDVDYVVIRQDR